MLDTPLLICYTKFKLRCNMSETPTAAPEAAPSEIDHNVRIITLITGETVIANFGQVREEDKFVAYQLLYPLALNLQTGEPDADGNEQFNVTYRRWNPFTPYEDHRINPASVVSAMPPASDILKNYVGKLKEANVNLAFLPNNGNDILGITDGEPKEPTGAATEGPVAAGTSTGN